MAFTLNSHDPTPGAAIPSSWGDAINANMVALNGYGFVTGFPESSGGVDSNTAGMLYQVLQGAAGTPIVEYPVLSANGSALSARKWNKNMPPDYGGSLIVSGIYEMPVAGSGAFVIGVRVAAFSTGGTASAEAFATQVKGTITADTVARRWTAFSLAIPSANVDSLLPNIPASFEFERLPADAGDTEGGTVNFVTVGFYHNLKGY